MQKKSWFKGNLKENKIGCHAEFISASHLIYNSQSVEILKQVQDDTVFYNGTKAFTLIELLVVVLIIGILAAVAVPQYKIAVAKARMTQLVTLANSVVQAQERYYLANGTYTTDWTELDIDIPHRQVSGNLLVGKAGWRLYLNPSGGVNGSVYAYGQNFLPGILLIFGYSHASTGWEDTRACYATADNSTANAVCKNATGKTAPDTEAGYGAQNVYFFK